jgi:hypothetical protein
MNINGIVISLAYVNANLLHMTARKDGVRIGRFRLNQSLDGTRVYTEAGVALVLPHNRYSLASDILGGKSATAGRLQCIRDVLKAAELTPEPDMYMNPATGSVDTLDGWFPHTLLDGLVKVTKDNTDAWVAA